MLFLLKQPKESQVKLFSFIAWHWSSIFSTTILLCLIFLFLFQLIFHSKTRLNNYFMKIQNYDTFHDDEQGESLLDSYETLGS